MIDNKNHEEGMTKNKKVPCFYCGPLKKAEFWLNSVITNKSP